MEKLIDICKGANRIEFMNTYMIMRDTNFFRTNQYIPIQEYTSNEIIQIKHRNFIHHALDAVCFRTTKFYYGYTSYIAFYFAKNTDGYIGIDNYFNNINFYIDACNGKIDIFKISNCTLEGILPISLSYTDTHSVCTCVIDMIHSYDIPSKVQYLHNINTISDFDAFYTSNGIQNSVYAKFKYLEILLSKSFIKYTLYNLHKTEWYMNASIEDKLEYLQQLIVP